MPSGTENIWPMSPIVAVEKVIIRMNNRVFLVDSPASSKI
jgi:hypothetical protein